MHFKQNVKIKTTIPLAQKLVLSINSRAVYHRDSCISQTLILLKFQAKNHGCGLYTRPLLSQGVNFPIKKRVINQNSLLLVEVVAPKGAVCLHLQVLSLLRAHQ